MKVVKKQNSKNSGGGGMTFLRVGGAGQKCVSSSIKHFWTRLAFMLLPTPPFGLKKYV